MNNQKEITKSTDISEDYQDWDEPYGDVIGSFYNLPDDPPPPDLFDRQEQDWGDYPGPDYPFRDTIEREIGGTTYVIHTECAGTEFLSGMVRRLISSEKEEK